jgi:hypothetical protein
MVEWAGEIEREVQMNLDANGRKRLESMKRALAAGVPLVGLLSGMGCASEAVAGADGMMGVLMPNQMQEERRVMGKIPPRVIKSPKQMNGKEDRAKDQNGAEMTESPEKPGMPVDGGEEAR